MSNFAIDSKLNFLLSADNIPMIAEIVFLGTGGAFDIKEKNSSMIIKLANSSILVDCGSTVYSVLREKNLVKDIDYVFVTHCHEDHIGSLSTLVFHKYFLENKPLHIECVPSLEKKIRTYLVDVCGHSEELENSFKINSNQGNVYENLNMIIHKIDTTGNHFTNFPTGGFVFNLRKNKKNFFIVYSGDINKSFIDVIEEKEPNLYSLMSENFDDVFIFHETAAKEYPPFYPHFLFHKISKIINVFPNVYTFHHGYDEAKKIIEEIRQENKVLELIKTNVDIELQNKASLLTEENHLENLNKQAKKIKEEIEYSILHNKLKSNDLSVIGENLVIYQKNKI